MCWKITQWVLGIILSSSRLKVSLLNWHKHKYECLSWPWMFAWLHTSLESPVSIWQRCLIPSLFEEVTCFDVYNRFIKTGLRCVSVGFVLMFKTFCTLNTCHTCLWLGWLLYRNDTHLNYVSEAYRQKKKKHRHHFLKICKLETNPSKKNSISQFIWVSNVPISELLLRREQEKLWSWWIRLCIKEIYEN